MDVNELYQKANGKYNVKIRQVLSTKKKFLTLYRTYMVYMYDKGYISDPTLFNEKEIYSNISDMGVKGMVTVYGQVNLTSEQCRYAYYKNKGDKEITDFLRLLELTLRFREYSQSVDKFYDCFNVSKQSVTRVGLKLSTSSGIVYSKCAITVDLAVLSCLIKENEEIFVHDIRDKVWLLAMRELGIPPYEWYSDGLIDKDLTHEEEVKCLELLLGGTVQSDGKYSELFNKWMFDHNWSKQSMYANQRSLYSYTMGNNSSAIDDHLNGVIAWLEHHEIEPLYASGCEVYGMKHTSSIIMPIGQFSLLQLEDGEYWGSDRNALEGYTGEAYHVDYLNKEEIIFVGCPIELYITDKETGSFVDLEQTEVNSYKSWFNIAGAVLNFDEGSLASTNTKSPVTNVFNIFHNSKIGEIIGVITSYLSERSIESTKASVYPYIKEDDNED